MNIINNNGRYINRNLQMKLMTLMKNFIKNKYNKQKY